MIKNLIYFDCILVADYLNESQRNIADYLLPFKESLKYPINIIQIKG